MAARNPRNAHRRLGPEHHLEEILSVRVARKVAPDHTVSWDGNRWGVVREEVCAGLRGAAVEIERRLDGSHWLRYRGRYLHLRACPEPGDRKSLRPTASRTCGTEQRDPKTKSNPNTMYLQITLGEDHGSGHFYLAKTRTFLLCVDTMTRSTRSTRSITIDSRSRRHDDTMTTMTRRRASCRPSWIRTRAHATS